MSRETPVFAWSAHTLQTQCCGRVSSSSSSSSSSIVHTLGWRVLPVLAAYDVFLACFYIETRVQRYQGVIIELKETSERANHRKTSLRFRDSLHHPLRVPYYKVPHRPPLHSSVNPAFTTRTNMPPRRSATITQSHAAYVEDQHKKAQDLEAQLDQMPTADRGQQQLRTPLCEAFSNLIIRDPRFAVQHNIASRMWTKCFYSRIEPWRRRIARDQRRGVDASRTQEALTLFITEGCTLYQYLIQKLQETLAKKHGLSTIAEDSNNNNSFSQDDSSSVVTSVASPPDQQQHTQGIVALLAAFHVNLGDLFRYAGNLKKAQVTYHMAATLAPGRGQAFNQLAVLCQLKEKEGSPLSAVALYWYTRALLVSQEPFVTAKSNLTRLFASNHQWLQEERKDGPGDITKDPQSFSSKRRFLGMFVDLHYQFFQGMGNDTTTNTFDAITKRLQQIKTVMDCLPSFLQASSFSDALLVKLIVIHSFSECFVDRERDSLLELNMVLARVATYALGLCLTEQVRQSFSQQGHKLATKMKLLLPILLLARFTDHVPMLTTEYSQAQQALEDARQAFWKSMAVLWNQLRAKVAPAEYLSYSAESDETELAAFLELREFGPYKFLPSCQGGLLSEEEALQELLQQHATIVGPPKDGQKINETASTGATSTSGAAVADQRRLKVVQLLQLAETIAHKADGEVGKCIGKTVNGDFVWLGPSDNDSIADNNNMMEAADEDETREGFEPMHVDSDREEQNEAPTGAIPEDVLVYKKGPGGGPALLVPNLLLQQNVTEEAQVEAREPPQNMDVDPTTATFGKSATPDPLPVFVASPVNRQPTETPLVVPHPKDPPVVPAGAPAFTSVAGVTLPPPGLGPSNNNGLVSPPPGFGSVVTTHPAPPTQPTQLSTNLGLDRPETIGEALRLYGSQMHTQTANPFVTPPAGLTGAFPYAAPANNSTTNLFGDDAMSTETALLDSGLLKSLWMDDPKSKSSNPFAA